MVTLPREMAAVPAPRNLVGNLVLGVLAHVSTGNAANLNLKLRGWNCVKGPSHLTPGTPPGRSCVAATKIII